ncbi:MAG: D-alanyl-D-alanine carboxypeptidase/D-alanyl-D-alanine-endopeptidase [Desulfopila sp.]
MLFFALVVLGSTLQPAAATILPRDTISNGGYIIYQDGGIIESFHPHDPFIPASTIKLLTAYTAIKELGADYRFTTSFYLDAAGLLYIRGGGDPTLTTESLIEVARELKRRGVVRISGYVLDDHLFALEHALPDGSENSANPYDVANSGLAVNFNSIAIDKTRSGRILSGEEHTPTIPLARVIGRQLKPGRHRVNIDAFVTPSSLPLPLQYTAELLHELLQRQGVVCRANFRRGTVAGGAKPIYRHLSAPLTSIVRSCLAVSNNYIANQLALTAGAHKYGAPATWGKARQVLTSYARNRMGVSPRELSVAEGSGLSRQTRITPTAMLKILLAFAPYRDLLPTRHGAQLKSGTMTNVYCYAGYLDSDRGPLLFVVLLNQQTNTRRELLTHLARQFAPSGTTSSGTGQ